LVIDGLGLMWQNLSGSFKIVSLIFKAVQISCSLLGIQVDSSADEVVVVVVISFLIKSSSDFTLRSEKNNNKLDVCYILKIYKIFLDL